MTEEEKMVFWGDLVEPIVALLGGLVVRGEFKLAEVVQSVVAKAENAAVEEREACAKIAEAYEPRCDSCPSGVANAIRARGQG